MLEDFIYFIQWNYIKLDSQNIINKINDFNAKVSIFSFSIVNNNQKYFWKYNNSQIQVLENQNNHP